MIELANVGKCFGSGTAKRFSAVEEVSLAIDSGKVTILRGPSGSGKTTLMTMIGCMSRPTSGRIALKGFPSAVRAVGGEGDTVDISSLPDRFLTEIRRTTFGFIFQQFNLVRGVSVLENVMLPARPTGADYRTYRDRALELMELMEIGRHAATRVERLSGGEMQRVAIARALINDPAIIVADEPTAHLDSRLSGEFMEIVGRFREQGKTVLIASHDPLVCDSPLADMVVTMRDGRVIHVDRKP